MSKDLINHRKTSATLQLLNWRGEPLANQEVCIHLTNHEFLFGCGASHAVDYTSVPKGQQKAFWEDRMKKWLDVFNYGTLHFYWGFFEPVEGKPNTLALLRAANYLNEHNVKVKGHPLCWHTCCADWLLKYSNEEILAKQKKRIQRDVSEFCNTIDAWDVINEVVIMPEYDRYDNAITRICKDLGRVNMVKTMFDEAKAANPDSFLLINDFNLSKNYETLIDDCLNAGVPISAIGIQTHQHQGYMGAERLYEILHRFEKFGLPLHFTENTLISGDLMPKEIVDLNDFQPQSWPSTMEGEARQAKEMEEMYRILFAHPLVEAITAWDFADGAWLGAPSGIIRKDNSTKPVYDMLKHLIKEEWMTSTTLKTNEDGWLTLEGYKGQYELQAGSCIASYQLSAKEKEARIHLV